ncbi:hypothetical protein BDQ17DRAFT_1416163 [Cyathus striatus]|nr:hypothetical protein BDQ17DRAFT_1416163 [Cyathus striatus]
MGSDFDILMGPEDIPEDDEEVEQDTTGYYPVALHNDVSDISSEEEEEEEEGRGGEESEEEIGGVDNRSHTPTQTSTMSLDHDDHMHRPDQIAQSNSWPASSDFTLLIPNQRRTRNLCSSSQTKSLQVPGPPMHSESSSASAEAFSCGHSRSSSTTGSSQSAYSSELLDALLKPVDCEASRKELLARIKELQAAVGILRSERNQAFNHAVILAREHSDLAEQVNSKANKKKRKGVRANAELLTSTEARQRRDEQRAEEEAKAQKKAETVARREERQHQVEERRAQMGVHHVFSGSLSSKNKDDLQDIATALSLSKEGKKSEILTRIQAYFDTNPDTKALPRFAGLFNRRATGHVAASSRNNQDQNPPPTAPTEQPLTLIPSHPAPVYSHPPPPVLAELSRYWQPHLPTQQHQYHESHYYQIPSHNYPSSSSSHYYHPTHPPH